MKKIALLSFQIQIMIHYVFGAQWGDEGKGKLVDYLAAKADYVVRFHGGNNAGHTVIIGKKRYPFHLLPSGLLNPKAIGVIANGVIIDLEVLIGEINNLAKDGYSLKNKLLISPRCHLIMPYHKALDEAYENARGKNKLGTTRRGIGPTFADKVSYNGLRIYELSDWPTFVEKFTFQAKIKNKILKLFAVKPISIKEELIKLANQRKIILPYVREVYPILQQALKNKKKILLEGAHGAMLDIDWSPYPYSTGSNIVRGAINTGAGLPVSRINRSWAVVKAYLSRVGGGPLPTEIFGKTADLIREKGKEFGTTTGRPRRIGWLDLEAVKFTTTIAEANRLAISKIDILSGIKEIKICVGYRLNGKKISYVESGYNELAKLTPTYRNFPGWDDPLEKIKRFNELPKNCRRYLKFISDFLEIPIAYIGVGPERSQFIKV